MRNAILLVTALAGFPRLPRWIFPENGLRGFTKINSSAGLVRLGDYLGIPINGADRQRGDSWDASLQTLPEWQCRPHQADYIWRGPSPLRISKEVDPVSREITAYHAEWLRSVDRPIYLDGRPHPPGVRGPHLGRLFHGQMGWRCDDHPGHSPQGRLRAAQRTGAQRPGHRDGALDPAWRLADGGHGGDRPGLSGGTFRSEHRL